jgi:type VI secretion system secreted protein Hcp
VRKEGFVASDYLLKIDGIKGESTDSKHKDEIEIESFSWGATQSGSFQSGGGGGAGKVAFQDFHFTTRVNVASPNLMVACASGQHIKLATLTVRKAGKDQQEYYIIKLSDNLVSSYQSGGSEGSNALPVDQFSLNFAKIEFEYKSQKPDGTLGPGVKGGWDLKKNVKI